MTDEDMEIVKRLHGLLANSRSQSDGLEAQIADLNTKFQYWVGRRHGIAECISLVEEATA